MRKPVPGFPAYLVNECGMVWTRRPKNGKGALAKKWRKVKPSPVNKWGHLMVRLRDGSGDYVNKLVHRLVLEVFVGPCPPGMVARHFPDRDPANNRLTNIQWGTYRENEVDKKVHGTSNRGSRNGRVKLTEVEVKQTKKSLANGDTVAELARRYKVSQATIYNIKINKTWGRLT